MRRLNNVKILVGDNKVYDDSFPPFETKILNFFNDLSNKINKYKNIDKYPDLISAAFFCRKANILNLKDKYLNDNQIRIGRGLVFHISPSNAPTNFLYSLIFGLLTGNSNIIKVSSKNYEQVKIICKLIKELLKKKYSDYKSYLKIIQYDNKNELITAEISKISDARIVWGGDNTIEMIKKFKLKPRAVDISFADRYSLCVINSINFLKLNTNMKESLVNNFYNDTFTLDQNACSSPHLILWYGTNVKKVKKVFWSLLANVIKKRYHLIESSSVNKYMLICKKLMQNDNIKDLEIYNNSLYTLSLKKLQNDVSNYRGQWGFFFQFQIKNLNYLKKIDTKKIQTLTYFGFNKTDLKKVVIKNHLKGVDRIVPIGQALDIDFTWDGYDIYNILTRSIDVR
jgi:hypothetical protein